MTEQVGLGCVKPKCGRIAFCRGLCTQHYHSLARRVKAGETTWARLAAAGECVAVVRGKRR